MPRIIVFRNKKSNLSFPEAAGKGFSPEEKSRFVSGFVLSLFIRLGARQATGSEGFPESLFGEPGSFLLAPLVRSPAVPAPGRERSEAPVRRLPESYPRL